MTRCALAVVSVILASSTGGASADGGPVLGEGRSEVVSADGSMRYVALTAGPVTLIAAIRTRDDGVQRMGWMRGSYTVPRVAYDGTTEGLTRDGRTLVLAPFVARGTETSHFAFVDTKDLRPRKVVTLRGAYAYDALSPDGQTLYLIQYLTGGTYRVRAYDARAKRLLPGAIVDKREAGEAMTGSPVTRVWRRGRAWAYTLYNRPGRPFVHALDTVHRRSVCIDLPWRNVQPAMWSVRMDLVPGGRTIVLQQPGVGRLASINTRTFGVRAFRRPVKQS
jgi:hypothetical protein